MRKPRSSGGPNDPTRYATAVGSVTGEPGSTDDAADLDGAAEQTVEEATPDRARPRSTPVALVLGRVLVGLVSAAVLAAMSVVYVRVDELDSSKNTTDALTEAQRGPNTPSSDDGANDILIVGNDSRTDMQGNPLSPELLRELRTEATETLNTDTLILLRLPHDGGKGAAISIPRDTSVTVPGLKRPEKINGAFGITKALTAQRLVNEGESDRKKVERESDDAGRTALIQAVQGLTGVRVDHYAEVSLYGFYLLTDAIDGVEVCLKHATSDPDSGASFAAGQQVVRGGDAVAFVRQRKNLPRGDLDRIVRQQTFLSSAMNKVLSGGLLTDTAKLNKLENAVSKTVVLDDGLHFLDLVNQARTLASGKVQFVTIPVTGVGARNDRGQSIITVDVKAVHKYVKALISANPPKPAPPATPSKFTGSRPLGLTAPAAAAGKSAVPCVD